MARRGGSSTGDQDISAHHGAAPTKYWFSTLPANIAFRQLVDIAKLRWRIERDYHELKQEVGLDTSKGEAGAASILTQRCASRPTDSSGTRSTGLFKEVKLPKAYRPRGSAIAA
jgi:hypothetical protein